MQGSPKVLDQSWQSPKGTWVQTRSWLTNPTGLASSKCRYWILSPLICVQKWVSVNAELSKGAGSILEPVSTQKGPGCKQIPGSQISLAWLQVQILTPLILWSPKELSLERHLCQVRNDGRHKRNRTRSTGFLGAASLSFAVAYPGLQSLPGSPQEASNA